MSIKKAVITAAGLGTRLLPATKETPKEMLPLFAENRNGQVCIKPLLQIIYEDLFNSGIRDFIIIRGKGKGSMEDHFTPDMHFLNDLRNIGKNDSADGLEEFYSKLEKSNICWVSQREPTGFGDAVLLAEPYVYEKFIVFAGDTFIKSKDYLMRMDRTCEKYKAAATLLIFEAEDPRSYGVIKYEKIDENTVKVTEAVEKPEVPPTNLCILPVYIFEPVIFEALKATPYGKGNERQLTDGIQKLIESGYDVYATKLLPGEKRLDIGNPKYLAEALYISGKLAGIDFSKFEVI